jgi:hypothetical protein
MLDVTVPVMNPAMTRLISVAATNPMPSPTAAGRGRSVAGRSSPLSSNERESCTSHDPSHPRCTHAHACHCCPKPSRMSACSISAIWRVGTPQSRCDGHVAMTSSRISHSSASSDCALGPGMFPLRSSIGSCSTPCYTAAPRTVTNAKTRRARIGTP